MAGASVDLLKETKEIIEKINFFKSRIEELNSFLELLDASNIKSRYSDKNYEKRNEFGYIEIASNIWTGSDNPTYRKRIVCKETLNMLAEMMKPVIRMKIEENKLRLQQLIK